MPMTQPPLLITLQDSEVSAIDTANGQAIVKFSAARVHRRAAHVGAVELSITGAAFASCTQGCIGRLADGEVRLDGERLVSLPVPWELQGVVSLSLVFANGEEFRASGRALHVRVRGEPRLVEHLHC